MVDILREKFAQERAADPSKLDTLFVALRSWQESFIDADQPTMLRLLGVVLPTDSVFDDRCNTLILSRNGNYSEFCNEPIIKYGAEETYAAASLTVDDESLEPEETSAAASLIAGYLPWCEQHAKQPFDVSRSVVDRKWEPTYPLPNMFIDIDLTINVCVFVEDRMVDSEQWKCALATATSQASRFQYEHRDQFSSSSFATVRFHGFAENAQHTVQQQQEQQKQQQRLWGDMFGLLNLLQGIDILCIQRLHNEFIEEDPDGKSLGNITFLGATLQSVNMWGWPIVTVFNGDVPMYVSLDFRREMNITPRMRALLTVAETHVQGHAVVFRFVFSTIHQVEWFNEFVFNIMKDLPDVMGIPNCLMHFVIQPNLLTSNTDWTKGKRFSRLLLAIRMSFYKNNRLWKHLDSPPVQIAQGDVIKGFHGYITMPDSTTQSLKLKTDSWMSQRIQCDRRILQNDQIKKYLTEFTNTGLLQEWPDWIF